jgi:hypothetical protein
VESTYLLYQATKNPFYLHVGRDIIHSLNNHTRCRRGFLIPSLYFIPVLRIRIRDRCLFDPWVRDPGWVKSQDPDGSGSGMNNPDHIS